LGEVARTEQQNDEGASSGFLITVDFTLRLSSCRFHERNFGSKSGQQKALENDVFSRACPFTNLSPRHWLKKY
jgi:hypothetical protein